MNVEDLRYCEPSHVLLLDNEALRVTNDTLRRFVSEHERDSLLREHAALWKRVTEIRERMARAGDADAAH